MSLPAVATSDTSSLSWDGSLRTLPISALNLARRFPALARQGWKHQRHWLFVLVPVLLTFVPFTITARDVWFGNDAAFWFQPLVPLLAFALAWEQRQDWQAFYRFQAEQFPAGHRRRRGYFFPVLLSCLLFVVASLTSIFGFWMGGLVVGIVTILYYLYGLDLLGRLWMPLVYLLVALPPPLTVVAWGTGVMQKVTAVVLATVLGPLKGGARFLGDAVLTPQVTIPVTVIESGRSILLPVLALTLWIAMRRRVTVFLSLVLFVIAAALSLAANLLRLILPALGNLIVPSDVTVFLNFVFVLLILWLTDVLARYFTRRPTSPYGMQAGWQQDGWPTR